MKIKFLFIVIVSSLMIEPVHSYGSDITDNNQYIELVNVWKVFLKAISTNDLKEIRNLSAERIRCLFCLDNTEEEEREIENFKTTEPDWYEKLYDDKVYIPISKFCKQDLPIIFTKKFIKKLLDSKPAFAVEDFNGKRIYEVIITTSKPGELFPGHEGGQQLFQFIKINSVLKFWGIDTIP